MSDEEEFQHEERGLLIALFVRNILLAIVKTGPK